MSWNTFLQSAGIRSDRFNTYDEAFKHFNTVKPIRGRSPELRPLGNNRAYTHCKIMHDALTDTVSAHLYDTECFSIDSSGVVKINRGDWISLITATFIDACLPSKWGTVFMYRNKIILRTRDRKEYEIPRDGLLLQASPNWEEVELVANQSAVPKIQYEYRANRKVLNKLRKAYAGFLSTLDVMSAMSTNYDIVEYCEYFPDLPQMYIDAENEHARQQTEATANIKSAHRGSFNAARNLKAILQNKCGAPRMSSLSELATTINAYKDGGDVNEWLKYKAEHVLNKELPRYMQVLKDGLSDDVQTLRRLMLSIVANPNNYAQDNGYGYGYGYNGYGYGYDYGDNLQLVTVPSLFGDVSMPKMWFNANGSQIESYFIDLIKYVYADVVFTKVEIPSGTMPKMTNNKYVVTHEFLAKNTDIVTKRHVVV